MSLLDLYRQFRTDRTNYPVNLDPYWASRKYSLELSSINKVSLVQVSTCSNTRSIRDDTYWTSREKSLVLIQLSSMNKVSLV